MHSPKDAFSLGRGLPGAASSCRLCDAFLFIGEIMDRGKQPPPQGSTMDFRGVFQNKICMDALLAVLCLTPLALSPWKVWENVALYEQTKGRDEGVRLQERFRPLRSVVGACDLLGYVSDIDAVKDGDQYWMEAKYINYAITPAYIDEQRPLPLVVGNFYKLDKIPQVLKDRGLRVLKDFGDGVMLLKWEGWR
jgi:hypothetical protein